MSYKLLLAAGLAAVTCARAADVTGSFSGPSLGYLFDSASRTVRPILGVAGAARLGSPLNLGREFSAAAILPGEDALLGASGEDLVLARWGAGGVSLRTVAEGLPGIEAIAWSPAGRFALVVQGGGRIEIVGGLPQAPAIDREIDGSSLGGAPSAWAVSDDGTLLVAVRGEGNGLLWLFPPGGGPRLLSAAAQVSAIAFWPDRPDVLVAVGGENRVYQVRDVTGAAEWLPLLDERDGIEEPTAVAVSGDGRRVVAASAKTGTVATLDLAAQARASVSCECVPAGLYRLRGHSVFRLTELAGEPLAVFDGDAAEARVVRIPVDGEREPLP